MSLLGFPHVFGVILIGSGVPVASKFCSSGGESRMGTRHLACDSAALPLVLIMFFVGDLGLQLFHHFSYSSISAALISCGTQRRILFPVQTYAFLLMHAMNITMNITFLASCSIITRIS